MLLGNLELSSVRCGHQHVAAADTPCRTHGVQDRLCISGSQPAWIVLVLL